MQARCCPQSADTAPTQGTGNGSIRTTARRRRSPAGARRRCALAADGRSGSSTESFPPGLVRSSVDVASREGICEMNAPSWSTQAPCARFDDLRTGTALAFSTSLCEVVADELDQVQTVLDEVDQALQAGWWAF